ncbi:MAG TPA: DUF4124 domain-containing protein [Chitinolyticbacter sp.]|nr:DUF4124 domain-containing protein [Chitinolyticbacter sp.]
MHNTRLQLTIASIWIVLALSAMPALAINKCIDQMGNVTYQDTKCPQGASEKAIKTQQARPLGTRAVSADAGTPLADDNSKDEAILKLVSVESTFDGCSSASPEFSRSHASTLEAWRSKNATMLQQYGKSQRYALLMERGRNQAQTLLATGGKENLAAFCEGRFIPMLKSRIGLSQ